jgi:hypothetical protein
MKLTRAQLRRLIQESMRIPGLDRVFDQIDADSPTSNTQSLPMSGARETFSQDTGLFGSNLERPDDMRDMNIPSSDPSRQSDNLLEARYALVYFRSYISALESYTKIHYAQSLDWAGWKRTPNAMNALYHVQGKLRKVYLAVTDAVNRHGNPEAHSPKRSIIIDNVEELREAAESGKLDAKETIRLEGYANAYMAVNDMSFVGHNHHLMTIQTAAETLGDRELVSSMIDFEGFDEDVNDGKVLELFDFFDIFDPDSQRFMKL